MSNFKLDGASLITDPRECEWMFTTVGHDGNGKPILAPFARARITRIWMTNAEFDEWFSKSVMDGYTSPVDVTLPAPGDGTFTEYPNCYLESVQGTRRDATHVYGVSILVVKIPY